MLSLDTVLILLVILADTTFCSECKACDVCQMQYVVEAFLKGCQKACYSGLQTRPTPDGGKIKDLKKFPPSFGAIVIQ